MKNVNIRKIDTGFLVECYTPVDKPNEIGIHNSFAYAIIDEALEKAKELLSA